jgi:hypothetical protein
MYLLHDALRAVSDGDIVRANHLWKKVISHKPGEPRGKWSQDICEQYLYKVCDFMKVYIGNTKDIKGIELPLPEWLGTIEEFPLVVPTFKLFIKHLYSYINSTTIQSEITTLRKSDRKPKSVQINAKDIRDTVNIQLMNVPHTFLFYQILELPIFRKEINFYILKGICYKKLCLDFVIESNRFKEKIFHSNYFQ